MNDLDLTTSHLKVQEKKNWAAGSFALSSENSGSSHNKLKVEKRGNE